MTSMPKSDLDEYLQQGIYGPKVTNPDERRKFLGTIRERIEVALTQSQVMEKVIYPEVEVKMKAYSQTHLFLNGHIDYSYLSKFIKKADLYKINYTIVTNKEYNSEIGLVLAHENAVDKEDIYVTPKNHVPEQQAPIQKQNKKNIFSFFKKLRTKK